MDIEEEKEQLKCGEILISSSIWNITFQCLFCSSTHTKIDEFLTHVKSQHFQFLINDDVKKELNEIHSDEDNVLNSIGIKEEFDQDEDEMNSKNFTMNEVDDEEKYQTINTDPLEEEDVFIKVNVLKRKRKRGCGDPNLLCNTCKKQFTSEKTFQKHKLFCQAAFQHSLHVSNLSEKTESLNDSEDDEQKTENKSDKSSDPIFVQSHEINPFMCRYCNRNFKNRPERVEHECLHTGEKLYKCEKCNKRFRLKSLLINHLKVHDGIKPYKCHICNAAFTFTSNYRVHIRRHLGEKPYKCDYCDMRFVASTEKKSHERKHTGEKPFQCIECGQCYSSQSHLTEHSKRHTGLKPVKCPECDKHFFSRKLMLRHIVIHSGIKKHKCDECEAAFVKRSALISHKKIHSDARDYICHICRKGFKQRPGLICHMKSHEKAVN